MATPHRHWGGTSNSLTRPLGGVPEHLRSLVLKGWLDATAELAAE
jgi:hypothetical protein